MNSIRLPILARLILALLTTMTLLYPANSAPLSFAGQRVLVLGDSITQNGGYVTFLEYYLNKNEPGQGFDIISVGLASETASGLTEKMHPFPRPYVHERLWAALDLVKPNIVVACYGMNDGIYHPQSPERMQAFQLGIRKLLAEAKAAGARVVLLTPPPFEATASNGVRPADAPDFSYAAPFDGYDQVLKDYAAWEVTLASPDVTVIDLHTDLSAFLAEQKKTNPGYHMTEDGIHPDELGHLRIAHSLLRAMGMPPKRSDLKTELADIRKDPLFALVRTHRQTRSEAWLPYIGYTRGDVFKTSSIDAAEAKARQLQQQIDSLRKTR